MARRFARPLAIALVVAIAIVSAATPFLDAKYYQAWFAWPGVLSAAQMPLLVAIIAFLLWRALGGKRDYLPFLLTLFLFGLSMVGLALSMWHYLIPGSFSLWVASDP